MAPRPPYNVGHRRKQNSSAVQYFAWKWIGDFIRELSHFIAYRIWSVVLVNEVDSNRDKVSLERSVKV